MRYFSLPAWRDGEPVLLAELILALGSSIFDVTWRCTAIEIGPGPEDHPLEAIESSEASIDTLTLLHLVTPDIQIIEGEVAGYKARGGEPSLAIMFRAVDSTSWDIGLSDDIAVQRFTEAFPEAVEMDPGLFDH